MDVIAMNPALAGVEAGADTKALEVAVDAAAARPLTPVCPAHRGLSYLPERPPVDIEFTDLTYTVPQGRKGSKMILRSVSGLFRSGELTAILGPSGAGKSTLLNVLAGYKTGDATGAININGRPRDLAVFRKLSRYIMQEDLLQQHITVHESMTIAADLKLGNTLSKAQKLTAIDEILDMLRLTKARDTQTSRLSGGERKRLSIAQELVNNPPVIFLDEPTTGLDDLSSSQCIQLLKMLARGGRTVICSVHTPSAKLFDMFDHVYIVSEGQCVFQGRGRDIVPFLAQLGLNCPKTYNPADFMVEAASGEYGNHTERMSAAVDNGRCYRWCKDPRTLQHQSSRTDIVHTSPGANYDFSSSSFMQFRILVYRMLLQIWRDSGYLLLVASMHFFVALIIGMLFYKMGNDGSKTIFNFGFCFTCIIVFMYIPMLPVLLKFPEEVQLLKREYFNRWYSLNAYFCAMTVSRLPTQIILGLLYIALVYPITDQPLETSRLLKFCVVCLLISVVSESFGLIIGSALSIVNSMFVGPAFSVPFMLLAVYGMGNGSDDNAIPLHYRLAMSLSYLRYGLEGIVVSIYGDNRARLICPDSEVFCQLEDPRQLLKEMGMEHVKYWVDVLALVIMFLLFRLLSYAVLRIRLSTSKPIPAVNFISRMVKTHLNINLR